MIWLLIVGIFLVLVAYSVAVNAVIDRIHLRRGDRALVARASGATSRADTLTCPRCRRAWPMVTFIGRTRCPGCKALVIGWQ